METGPTILNVVAVALVDGEGRVLMQRRRASAQHGGLWEFPGGKIDAGESPESAALREIEEELSVCLEAGDLEACSFSSAPMPTGSPFERVVILLYTARKWRGDPACLDGEEIGWVPVREIAALDMPPADYPLARALLARIENDPS
ncbi:MAG: (deoxy)nucleoside triphosphate pyrophosphohydrolase [Sphingomonadaceae bacterium]